MMNAIMVAVIKLNVDFLLNVMLSVIMMNAIMLGVIMLNVVMLSVVMPLQDFISTYKNITFCSLNNSSVLLMMILNPCKMI